MFLETLLCARDRLVLSYVGRDEITGEKRPPSAVLLECARSCRVATLQKMSEQIVRR